jgi:hypothetical protein
MLHSRNFGSLASGKFFLDRPQEFAQYLQGLYMRKMSSVQQIIGFSIQGKMNNEGPEEISRNSMLL